jgi:hypothetical protein
LFIAAPVARLSPCPAAPSLKPFARLRRRLLPSASSTQLVLELIQSLDDYISSYPDITSSIASEVESLLDETSEAIAGFDVALTLGSYGPLSLPRSTTGRLESGFGPEDEGFGDGGDTTWWPVRLRRDLVEGLFMSGLDESGLPLPAWACIELVAMATRRTGRVGEGERLKKELMDEGRRRWSEFQEKRRGRTSGGQMV